jgi:hypothetical protein
VKEGFVGELVTYIEYGGDVRFKWSGPATVDVQVEGSKDGSEIRWRDVDHFTIETEHLARASCEEFHQSVVKYIERENLRA